MKKLTSTISSLNRIGLTEPASKLKAIQQLYRYAAADFSKELEILKSLQDIALYFEGRPLNEPAPSGMTLPPYSLETDRKYIVYAGDDLTGYTKREVYLNGIPNFLDSFIKQYMGGKEGQLSGHERRQYSAVEEELLDVRKAVKDSYKQVSKPVEYDPAHHDPREISKTNVDAGLRGLQRVFFKLNKFQSQIENFYIPEVAKEHYGGTYVNGKFTPFTDEEREIVEKEKLDKAQIKPEASEIDQIDLSDLEEAEESAVDRQVSKTKIPIDDEAPMTEEQVRKMHEDLLKKVTSVQTIKIAEDTLEGPVPTVLAERALGEIANLKHEFKRIRELIDTKYAKQLKLTLEEFRAELRIRELLEYASEELQKEAMTKSAIRIMDKIHKEIKKEDKKEKSKKKQKEKKSTARGLLRAILQEGLPFDTEGLLTPDVIKDAWQLLQLDLKVAYEAFIKQLIGLHLGRKEVHTQTPEQKAADEAKFYKDMEEKHRNLMQRVDVTLSEKLQGAMAILRG